MFGSAGDDEFKLMEELRDKTNVNIPENLRNLQNKKIIHKDICNVKEMDGYVLSISDIN